MASVAVVASATLKPIARVSMNWKKLFPWSLRRSANLSTVRVFPSLCIRSITSSATSRNGGNKEMSEKEMAPSSYTWPDKQKPRVCILGGGFGGLYTALRLESLVWPDDKKPQVLLIDHSDRFVFKPLLYELLSGEVDAWEIAPRFSDLLSNTSIQFFQDRVKLLCPSDDLGMSGPTKLRFGGTVHLESGILIEYDW